MIAIIDETANSTSIGQHARHGIVRINLMAAVGSKFGVWPD